MRVASLVAVAATCAWFLCNGVEDMPDPRILWIPAVISTTVALTELTVGCLNYLELKKRMSRDEGYEE